MMTLFKKIFFNQAKNKQKNIISEEGTSEYWSVIANVKNKIPYGPAGKERKSGLKKFKAGAKVHIIGAYYGMCERIVVIGQHRNSGNYISCIISVNSVENLRVKKVYSKKILELLENGTKYNTGELAFSTKKEAEELAIVIPIWAKDLES